MLLKEERWTIQRKVSTQEQITVTLIKGQSLLVHPKESYANFVKNLITQQRRVSNCMNILQKLSLHHSHIMSEAARPILVTHGLCTLALLINWLVIWRTCISRVPIKALIRLSLEMVMHCQLLTLEKQHFIHHLAHYTSHKSFMFLLLLKTYYLFLLYAKLILFLWNFFLIVFWWRIWRPRHLCSKDSIRMASTAYHHHHNTIGHFTPPPNHSHLGIIFLVILLKESWGILSLLLK